MNRGITRLSAALGLAALLCSCASVGTKFQAGPPELVRSIRVVGLAPVLVDEPTHAVCDLADSIALEALIGEVEQSGAFAMVSADTLLAHVSGQGAVDAGALLAAAQGLGLDGVLFCRVGAYEASVTTMETVGWGLSFGPEGTRIYFDEEPVTNANWVGAKVSLQVAESTGGRLVAGSTFDTFKGKSYWVAPPPEGHIKDAVKGAFKPVAELWADSGKQRGQGASRQPN